MKKKESALTNLTKLYTLTFLKKRNAHGYELITSFTSKTGKKLSPGQIYPLLNEMKNDGLLQVSVEFQGNRKRKIYSLTEKGKKLCNNLLDTVKDLLS